jgi:hypothetical protein
MHVRELIRVASCVVAVLLLAGCATVESYDYSNYRAHRPRSILVIPPLNESTAVEATYGYLSTVTQPLAELGYYVFPVAIVDQLLKENGMPTAGEMHQVPLSKIAEITGADAVLFVTLQQYGSKYQLINSQTVVQAKARLVDTRTETLLWEGQATAQENSAHAGNIVGNLIAAAITQALNSKADNAHNVSRLANASLFGTKDTGLLYGPYSPKYDKAL